MAEFIPVAKVSDIADPGKEMLEVADRIVILIHAAGNFYCLDDVCTHDEGPLSDGQLADATIACPRHGAKFDIQNGRALSLPATAPTVVHETKVDGDQVFVKINDE